MPTYEYHCPTCSHRFETWQKMTDEPLTICPECGAPIHRVLFPTGIVFKGHGFYKTDHNGHGSSVATNSNGDSKKSETGSDGDAKQSETGSNGDAKQSETSSTSESASTTTTATK
jgi:putative FmdB family regulatory protein